MPRPEGEPNKKKGRRSIKNDVVQKLKEGADVLKILFELANSSKYTQSKTIETIRLALIKNGGDDELILESIPEGKEKIPNYADYLKKRLKSLSRPPKVIDDNEKLSLQSILEQQQEEKRTFEGDAANSGQKKYRDQFNWTNDKTPLLRFHSEYFAKIMVLFFS